MRAYARRSSLAARRSRRQPTRGPCWARILTRSHGELTASRVLTVDRDPFLRHHTIGVLHPDGTGATAGVPVVPFAVSLELACEAAGYLIGRAPAVLTLRDVRALRWLAVEDDRLSLTVRAAPSESGNGDVRVRVFDADDEQGPPAFELVASALANGVEAAEVPVPDAALPVIVDAGTFNRGIFHGAAFRALDAITAVGPRGIEARAVVPGTHDLLAGESAPGLLTPVGLVDAASQLVALWLAQVGQPPAAFPFQLDRYVQWGPPPGPGEVVIMRALVQQYGDMMRADIDVIDDAGTRRVHLGGLRTKTFDLPSTYADYVLRHEAASRLSAPAGAARRSVRRLPPGLVDRGRSIWISVLAKVALSPGERRAWLGLPREDRESWLLGRVAAKEAALDYLGADGLDLAVQALRADQTSDGLQVRLATPGVREIDVLVRVIEDAGGLTVEVVQDAAVQTLPR